MAGKACEIIIPGNVKHRLDWLRDTLEGQAILQALHPRQQSQRLRCACQPLAAQQAEMVIRHRDNSYHLARMPDSGHRHARGDCDFYSEPADTVDSGGGEYEGAIRFLGDLTDININFALRKATPPDHDPVTTVSTPRGGRSRRGAVGLGGLLSHLWNEAAINTWNGNQGRKWETLVKDLQAVVDGTTLGQRPLHDHLYLQKPEQQAWFPLAPAEVPACQSRYLLLFKINTAFCAHAGHAYLKTSGGHKIFIGKQELEGLLRSHPAARAEFDRRAGKEYQSLPHAPQLVCLALVQWATIDNAPWLCVQQATLMLTSWRFIPVESQYELQVADQLVAQRRMFIKPLRYDASAEVVFPDFLLADAGEHPLPMEVYGVSGNRRYEARKRAKRDYYSASGKPFWEWTPKRQTSMPPFPAALR